MGDLGINFKSQVRAGFLSFFLNFNKKPVANLRPET